MSCSEPLRCSNRTQQAGSSTVNVNQFKSSCAKTEIKHGPGLMRFFSFVKVLNFSRQELNKIKCKKLLRRYDDSPKLDLPLAGLYLLLF